VVAVRIRRSFARVSATYNKRNSHRVIHAIAARAANKAGSGNAVPVRRRDSWQARFGIQQKSARRSDKLNPSEISGNHHRDSSPLLW